MIRANHQAKSLEAAKEILEPVSNDEFYQASVKALKSAFWLVSFCTGVDEVAVESLYREYCEEQAFEVPDAVLGDEMEDFELVDCLADNADDGVVVPQLLRHVQEESAALDVEDAAEGKAAGNEQLLDFQLRRVPDASQLKALFQDSEEKAMVQIAEGDPRTLLEALGSVNMASPPDVFDRLWRLVMYLRHWKGGGDGHWVRDPRACRERSRTLTWYQSLG